MEVCRGDGMGILHTRWGFCKLDPEEYLEDLATAADQGCGRLAHQGSLLEEFGSGEENAACTMFQVQGLLARCQCQVAFDCKWPAA
jgi:hypothetical protein